MVCFFLCADLRKNCGGVPSKKEEYKVHHQKNEENDELRARFTKWLEVTLYRARVDYLKKQDSEKNMLYVPEIPEEFQADDLLDCEWLTGIQKGSAFDFTGEKLETAFQSLTPARQNILSLLFGEEKTPREVSDILGCSLQLVYRQRAAALDRLRVLLTGGGENHD